MLLRFIVQNLFCFAEETEFSMVASPDESHPEHVITSDKHRVLMTSALYGANAHGKSKLLQAMALAQRLIINGSKPGQKIPVQPFRLDADLFKQPSRFEFSILAQGVEYTYGFIVDSERVHEEWLFSRPNKKEVRLFERVTDASLKTEISVGSSLARAGSKDKEYLNFLIRGVRENQLFLTECVDRNFKNFNPVYEWFSKSLVIITPDTPFIPFVYMAHNSKNFRDFSNNCLKMADTGISEIIISDRKGDFASIFPNAPEEMRHDFEKDLKEGIVISNEAGMSTVYSEENELSQLNLVTMHQATDGSAVPFDIDDESSGTQRFLQMLPIMSTSQDDTRVFIVDELDRTLHPILSRMLVEIFIKTNKKNQLIFTTHETNLLDLDLLRRDEVWFVQKDQQGKAHLYSLNTFKVRPDLKIERGYLQGRFGAIPFIGDISALGWIVENSP